MKFFVENFEAVATTAFTILIRMSPTLKLHNNERYA